MAPPASALRADVERALKGTEQGWPNAIDTLSCETLGNIEFLSEAGNALGRADLRDLAARRMTMIVESAASRGDYRFGPGNGQFNLGYTLLRRLEYSLPDVMICE